MSLAIVTTTINPPTEAILKFCEITKRNHGKFYIVGDLKTPHEEYEKLVKQYSFVNYSYVRYLHPEWQASAYPELSDAIGWNCIQRRSIGYIAALSDNHTIIATVDDDNIPYDNWGKHLLIGKTIEVDEYQANHGVFDPLQATNYPHLWHRGYPIDYVPDRQTTYLGKRKIIPLVQADLWDGDPDIDAICRLTYKPICKFNVTTPFMSQQISPFNSQNTFVHKEVMKYYMMFPHVGRMDDIWASYFAQIATKCEVVYAPASVYQKRNVQNLITNMTNEQIGYRQTKQMLEMPHGTSHIDHFLSYVPDNSKKAYELYREIVKDL